MHLIRQVSSFGLIGIVATACHVTVGLTLHRAIGLSAANANAIAFSVALLVSFFGQARVTFPGAKTDTRAFLRFAAVAATGFGANQAIVWVVTRLLGGPYWAALVVIVLTVPAAAFLAMKYWALAAEASSRARPSLGSSDPDQIG